MKIYQLILFIIFFINILIKYSPFNFKEPQEMNRILSPILSSDGLHFIFSVRKWNSKLDKSYTNLQYTIIKTKEVKDLTPKQTGISDSSPYFLLYSLIMFSLIEM